MCVYSIGLESFLHHHFALFLKTETFYVNVTQGVKPYTTNGLNCPLHTRWPTSIKQKRGFHFVSCEPELVKYYRKFYNG